MRSYSARRGRRVLALAAALAGLTMAPGCGQGPRRAPVSGAVTLDGEPLPGGVLSFNPDNSKGNSARISCTGPVQAGRYTLVTSGVNRAETGSGAPPGWYKVTFLNNLRGKAASGTVVASKYLSPETTTVEVEVVDKPRPDAYDIRLTSK